VQLQHRANYRAVEAQETLKRAVSLADAHTPQFDVEGLLAEDEVVRSDLSVRPTRGSR
jgi:hypothetical protein